MKLTKVEKNESGQVELSIVVEKEAFEKACEESYRKNVKNINIQGFRKGKAPRKMIEKMYGKEIFFEDAMAFCYPEAYEKAVDEADIDPIDRPGLTDFDISDEGEFSFKAVVSVKPEVEIGTYKGLEAEKAAPMVDAAEIDAEIDRLRDRNSSLVTVERAVQDGDTVLLDFEGFVDDVPFEGGKGENFSLKIGSGMFIPGFEEQLIGKAIGEACEVNVTFPEQYNAEELAGKPALFKCKINEVKESVKPELDDEFAKDVSEFDTLAEFKADMESKMLERKTAQVESDFAEALHTQLVESLVVELPEVMVETQLDRVAEDFNYRLSMQGIGLDMYLQMNQMTMEQFRGLFRDQAIRQVKIRLALEKVAEREGIQVSQEDLDAEYKRMAEQYGMEEEKVREAIAPKPLSRDLAVQKAMDFVQESAKAGKPKAKKAPAKKAASKKAAKVDTEAEALETAEEAPAKKPAKKPTKKAAEKTEE